MNPMTSGPLYVEVLSRLCSWEAMQSLMLLRSQITAQRSDAELCAAENLSDCAQAEKERASTSA